LLVLYHLFHTTLSYWQTAFSKGGCDGFKRSFG
jgi:hypothetical protein